MLKVKRFLFLVIATTLFSCGRENVKLIDFRIEPTVNRLRFILRATVSSETELTVKYWRLTGKSDTIQFSRSGKVVNTIIYGFAPLSNYALELWSGEKLLKRDTIETQNLVEDYLKGFQLQNDDERFKGHVLFHQPINSEKHAYIIINDDAEVLWYQEFPGKEDAFSWTHNNSVIAILNREDIAEVDLTGRVKLHLIQGQGKLSRKPHHEIKVNSDGEIYVLTYVEIAKPESSSEKYKYAVDPVIQEDGILIMDSIGNAKWEWTVLDYLGDVINERFNGHANSVFQDSIGYVVSFRNINQVWRINYNGEVLWKFGENGDFDMRLEDLFDGQHAAYFTQNGNLIIFDNGINQETSRALEFQIDEVNLEYQLINSWTLPRELFTPKRGNAQKIGHYMLVSSTLTNTIVVLDQDGRIIWKLNLPEPTYRAEFKESLL